jgi:uncharacterized protein (TIGR04255 family)
MLKTTPTFTNPPLSEVVCGVVFKRLPNFAIPHVGLLWQEYQPEFQLFREVPPLDDSMEGAQENSMILEPMVNMPLPRFWFLKPEDDEVIQVQSDRFLYNWKPGTGGGEYPRFESVYAKFDSALSKFDKFVTESELGQLDYVRYELTYSNTIFDESGYTGIETVASIIPRLEGIASMADGSYPVGVRCFTRFNIESCGATGLIEYRTFRQSDDPKPGFLMMLTIKGFPGDPLRMSRVEWFQAAREWISRNFIEITSPHVQNTYWGKTNESV